MVFNTTAGVGVAIATLVADSLALYHCAEGLLPQQDTGLITGVTDTAQSISFKRWPSGNGYRGDCGQGPGRGGRGVLCGAGTVNATVTPASFTSISSRGTSGRRREEIH